MSSGVPRLRRIAAAWCVSAGGYDEMPAYSAQVSVRPRPHAPAGLARDDELVPVRPEVGGEDPAGVRLGRATGRAVVVGQIEVGDSEIERSSHDRPLRAAGRGVAEVVPEAEREHRQLEAAAAGPPIGHDVISIGRGREGGTVQEWHLGHYRGPHVVASIAYDGS